MKGKKKGLTLGGRLEWLVLVLILLVGLLFGDAARSQGIFQNQSIKGITKILSTHTWGPSTSIVHAQPNFHVVAPGVWRSAQVNFESLNRMKAYGLKTIVNLRSDGERKLWEDEFAKKTGIQMHHFPLSAYKIVPPKTVDAVLAILSDPKQQPVLIHCAAGKDRTGMIVAAYQLANTKGSFRDVFQEMMMYGFDQRYAPMLASLRLWSSEHGRLETAQEIALTEKKIADKKK